MVPEAHLRALRDFMESFSHHNRQLLEILHSYKSGETNKILASTYLLAGGVAPLVELSELQVHKDGLNGCRGEGVLRTPHYVNLQLAHVASDLFSFVILGIVEEEYGARELGIFGKEEEVCTTHTRESERELSTDG